MTCRAGSFRDRPHFGIVEVEHRFSRASEEIREQLPQLGHLLMVEADVGQHRDLGLVERDRAVALIDLADEQLGVADQSARERRLRASRNSSSPRRSSPSAGGGRRGGSSRSCRSRSTCRWCRRRATLRCAPLSNCARNCGRVRWVSPSSFARTTSGTVSSTAAEVTRVIPGCTPDPSCGNSWMPSERR